MRDKRDIRIVREKRFSAVSASSAVSQMPGRAHAPRAKLTAENAKNAATHLLWNPPVILRTRSACANKRDVRIVREKRFSAVSRAPRFRRCRGERMPREQSRTQRPQRTQRLIFSGILPSCCTPGLHHRINEVLGSFVRKRIFAFFAVFAFFRCRGERSRGSWLPRRHELDRAAGLAEADAHRGNPL